MVPFLRFLGNGKDKVIQLVADYIISPLGDGTTANLEAVLRGETRLREHSSVHGQPMQEPFVGSLFEQLPEMDGFTPFEALCIRAVEGTKAKGLSSESCVFILSTTKGDIWTSPADSARKIAGYFGNRVPPVVVSTACTSGVTAQVTALRLLNAGLYRRAVIIGCDVQNEFIVSGFQSFKALSSEPCRPFDVARQGLNAGEAVAAMVVESGTGDWSLTTGTIHNDANHISGPSRTAEGSLRCLQDVLEDVTPEEIAFVSVHGTGTSYNDEMESIALQRAGLSDVPVSALKGNYGHTMGAAGLMETILSINALERGLILPSKGFSQQGTTYPVNLCADVRQTREQAFIKLLSGFGGVNAAVLWKKGVTDAHAAREPQGAEAFEANWQTVREVHLGSEDDLVALYRQLAGDWPKFFKMDTLSKLGFVAVEKLLKGEGVTVDPEKTALILANRSSSIVNDRAYQATIADKANYYPSPALFVYTLPNIVTGEIAIRHHFYGETSFYVLGNEAEMQPVVESTLRRSKVNQAIVGWVECTDKNRYEANVKLMKRKI